MGLFVNLRENTCYTTKKFESCHYIWSNTSFFNNTRILIKKMVNCNNDHKISIQYIIQEFFKKSTLVIWK